MAFKMKNPMGNIANTKSHGTNANFKKSGMTKDGAPFIGGLVKGALGVGKKLLGGGLKGMMGGMGKKLMGGLGGKVGNVAQKVMGGIGEEAPQQQEPVRKDPFENEPSPKRYGPPPMTEEEQKNRRSAKDIMRDKKAFADKYFKK
tara:strand:- start:681 stop:1115 length:435 start_codon:yes stop_codon:yes gene_type:complete